MTAIALDTNLLLLLIIGEATGRAAGDRLKAYSDDDIRILRKCMKGYDRLVATPNVLTEVSNLWDRGLTGAWRDDVLDFLAATVNKCIEIVHPSKEAIQDDEFGRLGLADCVWLAVLDPGMTLLTDDVALCNIATSRGHKAVNFTTLRDFG